MIPGNILLITFPFILFSIVQFVSHRIYESRIKELPDEFIGTNAGLLKNEHVLLTFMPAPTLRLLLFAPDGSLMGEIRDLNMKWFMWMIPNFLSMLMAKRYELVDHEGRLLAKYHIKRGLFNKMTILDDQGGLIGSYQENRSFVKVNGMIYKEDGTEWMPIQTPGSVNSFEMPQKMGKRSFHTKKAGCLWSGGNDSRQIHPYFLFHPMLMKVLKSLSLGFVQPR